MLSLQVIKGEKVAICSICGKGFKGRNRQQNLQQHILTHTGERPFSCPYCPYTARQQSHVKCHIFRMHVKASSDVGNSDLKVKNSIGILNNTSSTVNKLSSDRSEFASRFNIVSEQTRPTSPRSVLFMQSNASNEVIFNN